MSFQPPYSENCQTHWTAANILEEENADPTGPVEKDIKKKEGEQLGKYS